MTTFNNTLSNTIVDINMDSSVTWSSTPNSSTVYYPAVIDVKTVEQINEEIANGTLKISHVYDRAPLICEEYAYCRDCTPSPGRLYIDESEESEETVEQINEESASTLNRSTMYDPVPLKNEEYANSRDSMTSPGNLYINESEHSENFIMNSDNMDGCSVTWSTPTIMSNTAPLCPIYDPSSLVDVKSIKKVYEKSFPRHPKAKLRRQRVNAYCVPKKLDFNQPEEDTE